MTTTHALIGDAARLVKAHGCRTTAKDLLDCKRVVPNVPIADAGAIATRILPPGMTFEQALRAGYAGRIDHEGYRKWLKTLPCDVCDRHPPSDPSHVNAYKGAGTKSPIFFAIPECRSCHNKYEADGDPDTEARLARAALYMLQAIFEGRLKWVNL